MIGRKTDEKEQVLLLEMKHLVLDTVSFKCASGIQVDLEFQGVVRILQKL